MDVKKISNSPLQRLRVIQLPQKTHFTPDRTPPPIFGTSSHLNQTSPPVHSEDGIPNEDDHKWDSCCMSMDKEAARFFSMLVLTFFILSFSFYEVSYGHPCNQSALWGLIGTMIGFWFDGPKIGQRVKKT